MVFETPQLEVVYYPGPIPSGPAALTLMGLAFDKIHFPNGYLSTGGYDIEEVKKEADRIDGLGLRDYNTAVLVGVLRFLPLIADLKDFCYFSGQNEQVFGNVDKGANELVKVLDEAIFGPPKPNFYPTYETGHHKALPGGQQYIDYPGSLYYPANAIVYAAQHGIPLVNDNPSMPIPALGGANAKDNAKLLSTILALECANLILPKIRVLLPQETLEMSEERGIGLFFKMLAAINREGNHWVKGGCDSKMLLPLYPILYPYSTRYSNENLGKYLDANFSGDQIKYVQAALLPWYHGDPYETSLLAFATGHSSCFLGGGHYPRGGSQRLSDELGKIIVDRGGAILTSHSVQEIIINRDRACGVVYHPNGEGTSGARTVHADVVIANAAIPHVANDLLPAPATQKLLTRIGRRITAISLLSVALKFSRPLSELGNRAYSTVVGHPRHTRFPQFVEATRTNDYAMKGFAITDYSLIDNGVAGGRQHLGVITIPDSPSQWEGLSGDACEAKKQMVATTLIKRVDEILPGASQNVEANEVVTPRAYFEQTNNPGGTPYGFAMTPRQLSTRMMTYDSPIRGLYFASAWVRPGAGFEGTMYAGYNCARQVLKGRSESKKQA
jgi:phytoene dehydrogenase-like protein